MTSGLNLSDGDKRILDRIQSDFPLVGGPYGLLAEQTGLSQEDAHGTVQGLRRSGVIRRIGASYVPARLGYVTSLVAAEVEPSRIEEAAAHASRYPAVTHNYQRDARINLWFTVIAPSPCHLQEVVASVADAVGVREIHALPALKTFKLRVDFPFGDAPPSTPQSAGSEAPDAQPCKFDALDRRIIRRTCGDIGRGLAPFDELAEELGVQRDVLLDRLRGYRRRGAMRRFGAILRHQKAGFSANAMAVLDVPDGRTDEVGMHLAARPEITHCYERPRFPGWPYNLYAMIHGREASHVKNLAGTLSQGKGIPDCRVLFSCREFKKTSMAYFADGLTPLPCGASHAALGMHGQKA